MTEKLLSGIFVTHSGHLADVPGGAQVCTREYLAVIAAVGIKVRICPLDVDRRLTTRVLKRIIPSAYYRRAGPSSLHEINRLVSEVNPDFIFLNQASLASLAPALKERVRSQCKIVLLSHGLESTDLLHDYRSHGPLPLTTGAQLSPRRTLGATILDECTLRNHIDVVCALSEFDVALEHWIGAKRVGWLPRIVQAAPLSWAPIGRRLGFVGTLDHTPNIEGLVFILEELKRLNVGSLRIRVAGGPKRSGEWLAAKYKVVDYLGPLADVDLSAEARTWNAFLHPVFCYAKGCSTKLATAISWQIPVVTTTIGCRGYLWREGGLIIAENPSEFARQSLRVLEKDVAGMARSRVAVAAETSPKIEEVAAKLSVLLEIGTNTAGTDPETFD